MGAGHGALWITSRALLLKSRLLVSGGPLKALKVFRKQGGVIKDRPRFQTLLSFDVAIPHGGFGARGGGPSIKEFISGFAQGKMLTQGLHRW